MLLFAAAALGLGWGCFSSRRLRKEKDWRCLLDCLLIALGMALAVIYAAQPLPALLLTASLGYNLISDLEDMLVSTIATYSAMLAVFCWQLLTGSLSGWSLAIAALIIVINLILDDNSSLVGGDGQEPAV